MSSAVSIVIPALGDFALLEGALESLVGALRDGGDADEVLVVDDSGENLLATRLAKSFPSVRCLANSENLGFARALSAGMLAARHEFVFAMNSDVRARQGFLFPLLEALQDPRVFAAVPRILLQGREERVESLVALRLEGGIARAAQPALEEEAQSVLDPKRWHSNPAEFLRSKLPVPFAVGGACLLRKSMFAALGGFDPAFEPFYLEDLDLGWRAWRAGFTCLYVGASVVEHHNRGTIGAVIPRAVVLTAIERNRLLFTWKHLDERRAIDQHLRELHRRVAEARVLEDRTLLTALCLALEDRSKVVADGRTLPPVEAACFERIQTASDPFRAA